MADAKLTIQTIAVSHVRVPLPWPAAVSTFRIPAVDTCAITLRTREGLSGIGWCAAFGAERCRALMAMVRDLFGVLINKDAADTEENWAAMRQAASFVGRDGISAMAIAALDTACWDIKARAAGAPLWKLLGGDRREIPCYASEGLWINASEEELKTEAESFIGRGHAGMKLRVGLPSLGDDIARTAAVRGVIGPDASLMVDANQGWSVEEAKAACRELSAFDLEWIEEPVDHEDMGDFRQIRVQRFDHVRIVEVAVTAGDENRLGLRERQHEGQLALAEYRHQRVEYSTGPHAGHI